MSTPAAPQLTALVQAYLDGDPDAIDIINMSVDVARTVGVVRDLDHTQGPDDHFDEIRGDCDQACDYLVPVFTRAQEKGLVGAHEL